MNKQKQRDVDIVFEYTRLRNRSTGYNVGSRIFSGGEDHVTTSYWQLIYCLGYLYDDPRD